MIKTVATSATLATVIFAATAAFAAAPDAGTCRAGAPEGYKWLASYVEDYRKSGKVSEWFTGSLKEHPNDYALKALNAYFAGKGDWANGWSKFEADGGKAADYADGLACAKVTP